MDAQISRSRPLVTVRQYREKMFSTSKKSDDDENNRGLEIVRRRRRSKEEDRATSYFVDFQEKDLVLT